MNFQNPTIPIVGGEKPRVGVTIPLLCRSTDSLRWSNTLTVLSRLKRQCPATEVALVLQESGAWEEAADILSGEETPKVSLYTVRVKGDLIRKSKLINAGVDILGEKCNWVLQLDADIIANYTKLVSYIEENGHNVGFIAPCRYFALLSQDDSEAIRRGTRIRLKVNTVNKYPGAGLVSFSTKAFKEAGRMNESFVGWGWEDVDFSIRMRSKFAYKLGSFVAVHLYHEPEVAGQERNYGIVKRLHPRRMTL